MQPTGLHPTFRLTLPNPLDSPAPDCALHTYVTLPSFLFVDKYQLSSTNFLASNNLRSVRSLTGETDLEAPGWTISKWGSAFLLELSIPRNAISKGAEGTCHADLPLHLRYLPIFKESSSASSTGQRNVSVPWPSVFWACPSDEGTKMNTNPFDRVNLGYDSLFGPRTIFHHLQPSLNADLLVEELTVPVLGLSGAKWVEVGTVSCVLVGFVWVCRQLLRTLRKDMANPEPRQKND